MSFPKSLTPVGGGGTNASQFGAFNKDVCP